MKVRLAHVSDLHFGDTNPDIIAAAKVWLSQASPDLIVVSGDISQSGRRREFAEAGAFFASLALPVLATAGNHDAPVYSPWLRLMSPYGRFQALGAVSAWRTPPLVAVETLHTARAVQWRNDWSQGAFDLKALNASLERMAPCTWRVLVAHHPPTTPFGAQVRSDARRGAAASKMIANNPNTLLLCGHVHRFNIARTDQGGAVCIAPTLAAGRPRAGGHGLVDICLDEEKAHLTLWLYGGERFEPAMEVIVEDHQRTNHRGGGGD